MRSTKETTKFVKDYLELRNKYPELLLTKEKNIKRDLLERWEKEVQHHPKWSWFSRGIWQDFKKKECE